MPGNSFGGNRWPLQAGQGKALVHSILRIGSAMWIALKTTPSGTQTLGIQPGNVCGSRGNCGAGREVGFEWPSDQAAVGGIAKRLPLRRGYGRDARPSTHQRDSATSTQSHLSPGHFRPNSHFHHVDGRYRHGTGITADRSRESQPQFINRLPGIAMGEVQRATNGCRNNLRLCKCDFLYLMVALTFGILSNVGVILHGRQSCGGNSPRRPSSCEWDNSPNPDRARTGDHLPLR